MNLKIVKSRRTRKDSPPARLAGYQAALLHHFYSIPSAAYSRKHFFSLKKKCIRSPPRFSQGFLIFFCFPSSPSCYQPYLFHYSLLKRSLVSTTTMARWWSQPLIHAWSFMEVVPHFK